MSQSAVTLRVRNDEHTPPGGWHVRHKDPDLLDSDNSLETLRLRTEEWLVRQRLDPAIATDLIHETTGRRLIAGGHADLVERTDASPRRKASQYAAGAQALMLKWWAESPIKGLLQGKFERGEAVFVEQQEADRRAAICTSCPHNVRPTGKGWLQNWADGAMRGSVMDREVKQQKSLAVCSVCSCELRAAVWWPADILLASTPAKLREGFPPANECWKAQIFSQASA